MKQYAISSTFDIAAVSNSCARTEAPIAVSAKWRRRLNVHIVMKTGIGPR